MELLNELENVKMPKIEYATVGKDEEWRVRRTFQDMADRTTMAIAHVPFTWPQQKLIMKEAYKMQRDKGDTLTKYDLWNACTSVASHRLKERNPKDKTYSTSTLSVRRDMMLRQVNKAFAVGGIVDQVLAWDDVKFADEADKWVTQGWEGKYPRWTSIGPVALIGKKKKREETDTTSTTDSEESPDEMAEPPPDVGAFNPMDSEDDE